MAKHKYISQDAAIDAVDVCNLHRGIIDALQAIISDIPSADVRPVVRGRWHDVYTSYRSIVSQTCSVCGKRHDTTVECEMPSFCPNCGADMRGEEG